MTKDEALRMALECIEAWDRGANASDYWRDRFEAITAIREALADHIRDATKMIEQPAPKDYRAFYDGKRWYSVEVEQPTQDAKQAVEAAVEQYAKTGNGRVLEATMRQIISNEALNKMAENARELGLDYEPPCKTGSQCASKCQQCEQPAQQEIEELTAQRDQLADILTRTANALKGQPAELQMHSWHDLPEVAQQLKAAQPSKPLTDEQAETAFKAWHYKHGNNTQGIKWVDDLLRSCWKAAIEAAHAKGDA